MRQFLMLFIMNLLIGCSTPSDESVSSTPSTTGSTDGSLIEQRCRSEFADAVEVTACVVTHKVNQGLSINGRMTAHETAIEHLGDQIAKLNDRIAELERKGD